MESILETLKRDEYRIGNCQAVLYDRRKPDLPQDYLYHLWQKMQGNRFNRRGGDGILKTLFCGMPDVSFPTVMGYLGQRPIVVVGVWQDEETFDEAGIGFPVTITTGERERSCFYGYGIFPDYWGSRDSETLGMLGLALTFLDLKFCSLLGIRYADNDLTSRWSRRFGFQDVGTIDKYMVRNGELVSAVASQLSRERFEQYVERKLIQAYRDGQLQDSNPQSPTEAAEQRILSLFE